ncbi:MAG: VTT domain-containing protein [Thaumarchaeota archaeon]|nr:VTT domain-containing protein [Candidatus Calditenuaceae archaeon]MDW8186731.1 VTT domain-containing protein [Nitrososphaerota archaeon]
MLRDLLEAMIEFARNHLLHIGPFGLALLSFTESIFFPVPPDALLVPMVLLDPANGPLYGAITVVSSVAGGLVGYYLGRRFGRPLLLRVAGKRNISALERYFDRYGALAVGLAAFTPLPFKVFTIGAGALGMRDVKGFIVAAAIGRAARFIPVSLFLSFYGEGMVDLILNYVDLIGWVTLAGVLAYAALLLIRKLALRREPSSLPQPSGP